MTGQRKTSEIHRAGTGGRIRSSVRDLRLDDPCTWLSPFFLDQQSTRFSTRTRRAVGLPRNKRTRSQLPRRAARGSAARQKILNQNKSRTAWYSTVLSPYGIGIVPYYCTVPVSVRLFIPWIRTVWDCNASVVAPPAHRQHYSYCRQEYCRQAGGRAQTRQAGGGGEWAGVGGRRAGRGGAVNSHGRGHMEPADVWNLAQC